jgi:hypothetical protein
MLARGRPFSSVTINREIISSVTITIIIVTLETGSMRGNKG